MSLAKEKVICALDTPDIEKALILIAKIKDEVAAIKLGLEFFTANGAKGVERIVATGIPVFLDLKFHDIPNTVAQAVKQATKLGVFMMTVHAAGGSKMLEFAAAAANDAAKEFQVKKPLIMAVTILTSLDEADIKEIGYDKSVEDQVIKFALLAKKSNCDGVICSPHELNILRDKVGSDFKLVVPGIRMESEIKTSNIQDQKRVLTPGEAIRLGADYLVIGRSITKAENPVGLIRDNF